MDPAEDNTTEQGRIKLPIVQQLGLVAVILLLIFGTALTQRLFSSESDEQPVKTIVERQPSPLSANETDPAERVEPFSEITITGQAAYVWDIANQRALYKKNESEPLPLASITKLMTALVAHELLNESESITINQTAILQDGISGLLPGETFDRRSLSDLTLVSSSNDGAFALAYAAGAVLSERDPANAFVQAMNIRAKEIGLQETYFKNPTGLDISLTEGGAYGTARDVAFLMEYILKNAPQILTVTKEDATEVINATGNVHGVENTNYYIDRIPGLIGSKTGYTDLAGGNLTVAFEAGLNRPIVVVVLGSTRQERFNDVITLVDETKYYLQQQQ